MIKYDVYLYNIIDNMKIIDTCHLTNKIASLLTAIAYKYNILTSCIRMRSWFQQCRHKSSIFSPCCSDVRKKCEMRERNIKENNEDNPTKEIRTNNENHPTQRHKSEQ